MAAAAYRRPVETGRIEELIEYHNPTPLSDELFQAVDAAADTYANLRRADLSRADLSGADLSRANLSYGAVPELHLGRRL